MLAVVDDFATYRPDYVFFCTKSSHIPRNHRDQPHNRNSGFNLPVVEKYRELYGGDILKGKYDHAMRERIAKIRGDFLVDYLVEARRRLNRAGVKVIAGATVSGLLQPGGPNLKLDWREIVRRRAADILLTLRSNIKQEIQLSLQGKKTLQTIKTTVNRTWTTIDLPIEIFAPDPAIRIILRPTKKSAVELKPLVLRKGD